MTHLLEIDQFGKPGIGKKKFTAVLKNARSASVSSHPIFEWIRSASINRPTLAFDMRTIEERMQWLSEVSRQFSVFPLCAVKSCTHPDFLDFAYKYIAGFDVSNVAEYSLLPANLRDRLVSVTSPVLTGTQDDFLSRGNKLLVTLDSQFQLEQHLSQKEPCEYALRIQGSELLRDASPADPAFYPATRFGFSPDEVKKLLAAPWMKNCLPVGFHVHHGSEVNKLSTYNTIASELVKLAEPLDGPLKYINLGGGWHGLGKQDLCDALENARRVFPQPCKVLFEPGRWFSEGAGYAVGTVVNLSRSGGVVKCTLDLSGKSHMHWSKARLLHFFEPGCEKSGVVQFFGPSCYEGDFIGKYYLPFETDLVRDAGLKHGKQIVFANISTYSAEWNTAFNGIPRADVVWINL